MQPSPWQPRQLFPLFFGEWNEMVLPCLPLLIICAISATALQVVRQVVFMLLIFSVSVKKLLSSPFRAVPTSAAIVSLLSPENNCYAFWKMVYNLVCVTSPLALFLMAVSYSFSVLSSSAIYWMSVIDWCWGVCLKIQSRCSVSQLLSAPHVLL